MPYDPVLGTVLIFAAYLLVALAAVLFLRLLLAAHLKNRQALQKAREAAPTSRTPSQPTPLGGKP